MSVDSRKRVTDGSKVCGAFHPSEPYNCTGERGHPGDHLEHGPGSEILARWPADETVAALRRELADAHAEVERLTMELDRRHHDKVAAELRMKRLQEGLQEIADALRTVYKGSDSGLPALALRRRALAILAAHSNLAPGTDPPAEATE